MSSVGRLTIGSLTAFPNTRLQPMPWSLRIISPWGYFSDNNKIGIKPNASIHTYHTTTKPSHHVGQLNFVRNAVKPIVGIVHLTAYDYQARAGATTPVPQGSKIYIDGVQVAAIGNIGYASFQMHANDSHVIRVEMVDPYWGLPTVSYAESTQIVALDETINVTINVPRARYEPWLFNIYVDSKIGSGIFTPVSADISVDSISNGTTDSNGYKRVVAPDQDSHEYVVSIVDGAVSNDETYRVRASCTYGNSNVTAIMVGTPPKFDFKSELQYIYDFTLSSTSRVIDLVESGTFFNGDPLIITPTYLGDIVDISYTITSSAGVDIRNSGSAPFVWTWLPDSTTVPDLVNIEARFTDSNGNGGTYSETFTIHSKHIHTARAINDSASLQHPVALAGIRVYVDNIQVGITNSGGYFSVIFQDTLSHIITLKADNPESTITDTLVVSHIVTATPDTTSSYDYVFEWLGGILIPNNPSTPYWNYWEERYYIY